VTDNFEYISHSRLEYHHGYRHAYLGEVPQPVVYGVQGGLRAYYGAGEGPPDLDLFRRRTFRVHLGLRRG